MMRPGIRRRLLLSMAGILVFFALVLVALNSTVLESYYTYMEKRMLKIQTAAVEKIVAGTEDPNELGGKLEQLERRNSLTVSIIGSDGTPIYFTRMGIFDRPIDRKPEFKPAPIRDDRMEDFSVTSREELADGSVFETQKDPKLDIRYMSIRKTLDDGSTMDVRVTLSSIERGARIASIFTIYATALGLIAAAFWSVLFSRRFTEPLVQMNSIAGSIADLDFSKKCEVRTDDEIGQLGKSINGLSEKLSAALDDLKAKNALLTDELDRERRLDRMRKEFVANVSHELRTPISVIQGYADGLRMNIASDETKRKYYCETIISEAERMNRLVGNLLELSQYESGGAKPVKSQFDLVELAQRVIEKCVPDIDKERLRLELPKSAPSFADEKGIEQVLINYINNAREHLATEGTISVAVEESADMSSWVISVTNDGAPIPEASLPYIWDSFYRADKARNRQNGRYGLGLSIVRAIQQMHGKAFGAQNLDGKVRFWAEVDRYEEEA
ncbi:MAG TPA: HAMP domain-containing sensor histidine kinase [Bacillota bacterium]|nr:HAMP domain-containing sensor histidine kinase [Bacillota bacterium]